jgi:AraC family transcriptional regulator, regulatory protein of adaptative response / methylated-DNA-[protein]-cysteine methyltransferase
MATRTPPTTVYLIAFESPLGPLQLGATDDGVCLLAFHADPAKSFEVLGDRFRGLVIQDANRHLESAVGQLTEYFGGKRRTFDLPLDLRGTPFQEKVWKQLLKIPYGKTWSYEQLSVKAGSGVTGCRAVGTANGRNRISIVIPCHRVINKSGDLGGYGGQIWRKEWLLKHEGIAVEV